MSALLAMLRALVAAGAAGQTAVRIASHLVTSRTHVAQMGALLGSEPGVMEAPRIHRLSLPSPASPHPPSLQVRRRFQLYDQKRRHLLGQLPLPCTKEHLPGRPHPRLPPGQLFHAAYQERPGHAAGA